MEHHDLVLLFLRFQIEQFDTFHKKAKKYAIDAETASENHVSNTEGLIQRVVIPTAGANHAIILGAKQKMLSIREHLEDQGADQAFLAFRSRISSAIQALSSGSADAIALNDSHQVRSLISFMSQGAIDVQPITSDHRVSVHQGEIRISG